MKVIVVTMVAYHCYQLDTLFYLDFLSRLSPYVKEHFRVTQCGFQRNKSTTDQIFIINQILENKWE
jgi:hypothetical protein